MINANPVIMVGITHSIRLDKPMDDLANPSDTIKRINAAGMEHAIQMYR
jgi:hypothetical protein